MKTGPGHEAEAAGLEQAGSGDVGRQQVRRALDAGHREVERAGEARASSVLPVPGTSSSRTWPSASSASDQAERLLGADDRPRDRARRSSHRRRPAPGHRLCHRSGLRGAGCNGRVGHGGAAVRSVSVARRLLPPGGLAVFGKPTAAPPSGSRSTSAATGPQPRRPLESLGAPPPLPRSTRVAAVARPHPRPARSDPRPDRGVQERPAGGQDQPLLGRVRGRDRHDAGPAARSSRPSAAWRRPPGPSSTGRSTARPATATSCARLSSAPTTRR